MNTLKTSHGNSKHDYKSFSLPAGKSCPSALDCLASVEIVDDKRKVKDGKFSKIRCYSASQEAQYPSVYNMRKYNFDLLKACKSVNEIYNLLDASIPKIKFSPFRIHVGGDFFNQRYFDAWLKLARNNPKCIYYAYTKSLRYWVNRLNEIPHNFKLVASVGGRQDYLIEKYNLISAHVVFTELQAEKLNLEIDHDDSLAIENNKSFALDIHGTQKAKSKASLIISERKKKGEKIGYSKK